MGNITYITLWVGGSQIVISVVPYCNGIHFQGNTICALNCFYSTEMRVLAATVANTSYPSGMTALVPGMNMHGHKKTPMTTAIGVRLSPQMFILVSVKKIGSPDGR